MDSQFDSRVSPDTAEAGQFDGEDESSAQLQVFARVCRDLGKLFGVEASNATSEIPGLLFLLVIRIPVLIFLWLGLSIMLSWITFELIAIRWTGFLAFVLLQVILLCFIQMSIKRKKYLLSLPEFRKQAARFGKLFKDEDKSLQSSNKEGQ